MKAEDLYDALTHVPAELVEAAETHRFRKKIRWGAVAALAAAVVLTLGVAGAVTGRLPLPFMAKAPGPANSGGGGEMMDYAGPVLPLTVRGEAEGITVSRHTDFDFSPYIPRAETAEGRTYETWRRRAAVTDAYVLKNETDRDVTLSLLYPVVLRLSGEAGEFPVFTADGAEVSAELFVGAGHGTLPGPDGARRELSQIRGWDELYGILESGSYRDSAFAPDPDLNVPVTVYKVYDYAVSPTKAVNPTLQFAFTLDPEKTGVLSFGANAIKNDPETGVFYRAVGGLDRDDPEPMYILFYGEDIRDYTLQGYANSGCYPGDEIDVTASVLRYETTLEEFLLGVIDRQLQTDPQLASGETPVTRELLYRVTAEYLTGRGVLNSDPTRWWGIGDLWEASTAFHLRRVVYFALEVTVPAGESLEVTAKMLRNASMNFTGNARGEDGYDLAGSLVSGLTFTEETVSVSGTEGIRLLSDSFGFDPDSGAAEAVLDPTSSYGWMKVTKK